jgi:hypothetical protein
VRKILFKEGSFATLNHSADRADTLVVYRLYGFSEGLIFGLGANLA